MCGSASYWSLWPRLVGDSLWTRLSVKHDPIKAHGTFANPGGKANRINAAS